MNSVALIGAKVLNAGEMVGSAILLMQAALVRGGAIFCWKDQWMLVMYQHTDEAESCQNQT